MTGKRRHKAPGRAGPAPTSLDVQVLQTAASLENLAVAAYHAAGLLELGRHGYPILGSFVARSQRQHSAHAAAFNAAAARAHGAAQHAADPRYAATVHADMLHMTEAEPVVSLLESLEDVNAQSYTRYASLAISPALRQLFVSVAVAEAEHRSFLLVAQLLLDAGPADLLRVPTVPGELPAAIGTKCVPPAFYPTAAASAIDQGTVQ
jgi:Ferritin-like domain